LDIINKKGGWRFSAKKHTKNGQKNEAVKSEVAMKEEGKKLKSDEE